ncbi:efflux RND transporter permease subunit [Microvenator marinus]|uniref:Efflux RND transporter permease subunit n=1 Tax=Microvenator marinus TaxID=2600177 RepID=A0A5B8XS49_9DELT|nr:CusA/CzcA family heavy metal efflux RND transporter [Microvenator marinus]QED28490.1 efflux RND transporter permease subunit [Microvenator marinus]
MWLLHRIIELSVRHRTFVLFGVLAFVFVGVWGVSQARFDAFPDLTNVQVQVLTASAGMASEEVELLVTLPIERELSGIPGVQELRSLSRTGISAVTVVFVDGTDIWHARQLVKERLDAAREAIPETAGTPAIGPPATGLGEVYQFTVASDRHTKYELYRIYERDIAPRLVAVDGVVEVNAWGGGTPQLDVNLDPYRLAARGMTAGEVAEGIQSALGLVTGGAMVDGPEQILVRAISNPTSPDEVEAIVLRVDDAGRPIYVRDVAEVVESGALTVGMGSADGRGEVLFAMAQLLTGADALSVVDDLRDRMETVKEALPDGVQVEVIYDRKKLVGSTLFTVGKSLAEGGLLVILVLLLMLGDVRSGLLVASVIPLSMLGAFLGLNLLGYSGNLMSLGAIDFGLIVDGTIVVAESIVALELVRREDLREKVIERTRSVAGPVLFAVGILILVYIPILTMTGVEGKLFRPMALTVLLALTTALILSFTYIPAAASILVRPKGHQQTWLTAKLESLYTPTLRAAMHRPFAAVSAALGVLAVSVVAAMTMGVEFVPQLQEGDIVVQTARVPSISAEQALEDVSRIERLLGEFPEVARVASRSGAPALATDPMGLEESDILVKLHPMSEWTTGRTQEELVQAMSERLEGEELGAELTFTQPIEMRFNELLEGITSDVGVKVFGPELGTLMAISQDVAAQLESVEGAADVSAPTIEGVPGLEARLQPDRIQVLGASTENILMLVAGVQRGTEIGSVQRGQFRDPIVMKTAWDAGVPISDMPIATRHGGGTSMGSIADVLNVTTPATIEREAGSRRFVVESNVRGRDLGSFVREAQDRVAQNVKLPDGYWLEWSGKYEQLRSAATRTAITVPIILFLILGVLYVAFRDWRSALLIFLNVPVAASGGIIALWSRGLPVSMSAIVGLIALFGIAVMNGIVLLSRTRELHQMMSAAEAATRSASERFRPVLMTAFVAGIGFLPMALQVGIGAEVQRPLATVVIGGLVTSTLLTLVVLPTLYARFGRRSEEPRAAE